MYDDFKVANYPKSVVSPELYARHLSRLFTGDVIDGFTVSPGTGLQVVLAPGNALIRYGSSAVASAREVSLVNNFNLAVGTPDASNPRIDLVVVYVDNSVSLPSGTPSAANLDGKGVAKAKIVPGTPAATPAAPNATAIQASVGAGNPYTVVAQVRVNAGVLVIASDKITDARSMVFATSGTKLGSVSSSTPQSGIGQTATQVTGLSCPVVVPAGGRGVRISAFISGLYSVTNNNAMELSIWDGPVGTGTLLVTSETFSISAGGFPTFHLATVDHTPAAGLRTYNASLRINSAGTITTDLSGAKRASLTVELL